jgi:hypothetical protein
MQNFKNVLQVIAPNEYIHIFYASAQVSVKLKGKAAAQQKRNTTAV